MIQGVVHEQFAELPDLFEAVLHRMFADCAEHEVRFAVLYVDWSSPGVGSKRDADEGRMFRRILGKIATDVRSSDCVFPWNSGARCLVIVPDVGRSVAERIVKRLQSDIAAMVGRPASLARVLVGVAACPDDGRDAVSLISSLQRVITAGAATSAD